MVLYIIGPERLLFDATIGDQLASKLPTGKSIEILAVGSRTDWNIADQYVQYLKTKGFAVSFTRTSETVPPFGHKNTIRDDATTSPIIVIIAPSAFSEERRSHVGQTCLYWATSANRGSYRAINK